MTLINGDIEIDSEGDEVYIFARQKKDSNEIEEISTKVKTLSKRVQNFIQENKRVITNIN
jgi:hypothetical protein